MGMRFQPLVRGPGMTKLMNNAKLGAYMATLGLEAGAIVRATTVRQKGKKTDFPHNADSVQVRPEFFTGPDNNRAGVHISTMKAYSMVREVGGKTNSKPEHSLMRAIGAVSGGKAGNFRFSRGGSRSNLLKRMGY